MGWQVGRADDEFTERMLDEAQWFEQGERVDFFPTNHPLRRRLESAALGRYKVLGCSRVQADGQTWLDVMLRPFDYR
jgi:hypothetical protein